MKANEFVKKFGIEKAKEFLDLPSYTVDQLLMLQSGLRCDELQKLVESHELVEKHGGLVSSKKYLKFLQSSVDIGLYHGLDNVDYKTEIPEMEKAIADVESCGVSK
ncbi:hypothetical protein [Acinetobacter gerneri]|uniref:hypothetical protein n=1 Tax=Acinetobacter gerneri TaxID=202952 RepID=UPI0028AA1796|nr:hypothetical protein [Acinetobacter gerneri]